MASISRKEYNKQYYIKNRLKFIKYSEEYNKKNKEKKLKYGKEYRIKNKEIIRLKRNENLNNQRSYRQSKHGKIISLLLSIKARCYNQKKEGYKYYGGKGIISKLTYEDLSFLWDRDDAMSMRIPSIDRINNNKNYTLENCRFLEMAENMSRANRKPIVQKTLDGKIVRFWKSTVSASKKLKLNKNYIGECCRGSLSEYNGFIWEFFIIKNS